MKFADPKNDENIEMTWNKKELEVYDYVSLKEFDEINALRTAKKEGVEEGLKKGIQKGKEEGKKEEKINIAKNLLDILDDETISKKIGLDIETIQSLRKG